MTVLVVGSTGLLGMEIVRLLTGSGSPTRALVRTKSDQLKIEAAPRLGAQPVTGDLKDRASLDAACRGVDVVVTTATAILSQNEGDTIESVDRDGQLTLVDAAERAGVRRFVFVSFPRLDVAFPLQDAKRAVEDALAASDLEHTSIQPAHFMEIWLSPMMGFDAGNGSARCYGDGSARISWISYRDVARLVVRAATAEAPAPTLAAGGPDDLSTLEVVRIFEEETGRTFAVEHVSEAVLEAQHAAAATSLEQSFAGLLLGTARATPIERAPVENLTSVREFARAQI